MKLERWGVTLSTLNLIDLSTLCCLYCRYNTGVGVVHDIVALGRGCHSLAYKQIDMAHRIGTSENVLELCLTGVLGTATQIWFTQGKGMIFVTIIGGPSTVQFKKQSSKPKESTVKSAQIKCS